MPALSLSSLIVDLVASMETTVISLREHHLSGQAVHHLLREASAGQYLDAPRATLCVTPRATPCATPGAAPHLTGARRLRQEGPEQASGDQCGVAVDQPVADRA